MTGTLGLTVFGCEPDEADVFRALAPRYGIAPTITPDAVGDAELASAPGTRCVSVGHKSEVSGTTLRTLRDAGVEHLSTRSIGVNHIDLCAAAHLGITVENAVYDPDGVADFTVMLILMALRDADGILRAADRNDFRLRDVRGRDLRDLTVGVVGVGNIGRAVIRRLRGFGCRVVSSECARLDELLRASDVVTLHLPLNTRTHHVIGRRELALMRPGAVLVNTGRGALVDTGALVAALEDGALGGAALDVLEGEEGLFYADCRGRPIDHDLLVRLQRLPNVVVTPHTAYYTQRALQDTIEQTLSKCRDFERGRRNG